MIFAHRRLHRRVSLLAAGLVSAHDEAEVRAHLQTCARCRAEHEELRAVVATLASDPVRTAEPGIAASVLASRVLEAVRRTEPSPSPTRWWLAALPAAAALAAVAFLAPGLADRFRTAPQVALAPIPPAEASQLLSDDALARIERNLAREQAARYLNEAGDVLVSVAASGVDCERADGSLDVGAAPERSRELLEKRRLVVDSGGEAVASAQSVLDDVELALRQVAELPSCVKRRDVELVQKDVEERQLLMRIRLMTRELEG